MGILLLTLVAEETQPSSMWPILALPACLVCQDTRALKEKVCRLDQHYVDPGIDIPIHMQVQLLPFVDTIYGRTVV